MLRGLIGWSLDNPLIVLLLTAVLVVVGLHAFTNINVEAYPDPAPAIVEVIAQFPSASAEEVERQVTIPLEVTLAGIPGLKYTRTKSLFGLSHLRNQFEYGIDFNKARQEVINRLQFVSNLPAGVTPVISPESPTGEIFRYTLKSPVDALGRDIYSLNDLKALQDWVLEREFRRLPGIIDVSSSGGKVKRYEIHPDPNRMKLFGISLSQLQSAISNSNANVGGDYVMQGDVAMNARGVSLIGGGQDPTVRVLGLNDPDPRAAAELEEAEKAKRIDVLDLREAQRTRLATEAVTFLRAEDERRIREIRQIVVTAINNREILVEDLVEGGRLAADQKAGERGVIIGNLTRLGRVGLSTPLQKTGTQATGIYRLTDKNGKTIWRDQDDKVQCIVLLRKNADSLPTLREVEKKVAALNRPQSDKMLPGVQIEPYYNRSDLIHKTTETVQENLIVGMSLVAIILLMFLSNIRTAIIVALNIPLALLFAFSILFYRGKSANLLSIGAVDFGIIVDSSVIVVENIYRHVSTGLDAELPLKQRILRSCAEVERALLFSTLIMVCAFIPLFTMQGPEGQIFGPMADTYAFALGGALLLAIVVAPVLCLLFFGNLKQIPDNFLVIWLKNGYLRQLETCLNHRWTTLGIFVFLIAATVFGVMPFLGREFMPQLEEGNLWIRGTFPLNMSLDRVSVDSNQARGIIRSYPEVESVVPLIGRPDDGIDPCGFYNCEIFVPLISEKIWPNMVKRKGIRFPWMNEKRPRIKEELVIEMRAELSRKLPGIDWNFSQNIRDNVMESLSGVKGDNSVKIIGPDLNELERLAEKIKNRLRNIRGMTSVGVFRIKGQTNLEFRIDLEKCKRWGVQSGDINAVIQTALGGKAFGSVIEGEKIFDLTLRWPAWRRNSESSILDIPVEIVNNQVVLPGGPSGTPNPFGFSQTGPASTGFQVDTRNVITAMPRLRLRDLVSPVNQYGQADPKGQFERPGASTIYREQGQRLIAVKFSVDSTKRDLAGAVEEAQRETADLIKAPYRIEWDGEFQEMQEAEARLMIIIPASLTLIFLLLYFAFHSVLDALLVLMNVVALSLGGIWALWLTNTNFSISAAVGFISIFGVAIMDGLLLVSYFNQMRAHGLPLRDAILQGAEKRVRPVMMTAMTAIFGLLPAALSTAIGSQTQRPLAIVVVGGMITTLFLTRYLMPLLYSFYGHREPPAGASSMAH